MANYLDSLKAARDDAAARLAEALAAPKPSYSIHGQSVSWTEYQKMLAEQIAILSDLIARGEPFEIVSVGVT